MQMIPMRLIALTLTYSLITIAKMAEAQTYFLNGNAVDVGDDCYQLTGELNNQNGTVWYAEQIDLLQPFAIQFRMNLGQLDGNGADGICFVLQTVGTGAIGADGGGMGYLNFGTSLGIEFDTWQNGDYDDPGFDHIAIEKNGDIDHNSSNNIAGPVQADVFDQNIEDGEDHVVLIEWDPVLERLRVYFDCVFRLQGDIDLVNSIFQGNSLVYWGFTAATGGAFNNQSVCLQPNILNVGDQVIMCQGMSATLSVGSSVDGNYQWTPSDYLDDPTSPTPVTSAPEDIVYTVNYVDLCGDTLEQSISVEVAPLEVTALVSELINCQNEEVVVQLEGNIPLATDIEIFDDAGNLLFTSVNIVNWSAGTPGEYIVQAHVGDVCADSTVFEVLADFTQVELEAGDDIVLNCYTPFDSTNAASSNAQAAINWYWNGAALPNDNTLQLPINQAGAYVVVAVEPNSLCWSFDTLMVTLDFVNPVISIPAQDTLTCLQPQIQIQGVQVTSVHDYSVMWNENLGLALQGGTTIAPIVQSPGYYEIVVTDLVNGCQGAVGTVVVADQWEPIDAHRLQFPNIISDNSDGLNAAWRVYLIDDPTLVQEQLFDQWHLQVYNRWGVLIDEVNSPQELWYGSSVEAGVYFYILEFTVLCGDQDRQLKEGYIHLIK
jgi:Bacterial lectin/CHU_C Type IX secretion signal domain